MHREEVIVTNYQEVIQLIKSYDNGNDEMLSIAIQLVEILERIPQASIGEIYAKITEDNLLKMGIRHNNDRFRLVQILIGFSVVGVVTCMMKDSLNFQLENSTAFNSMDEMATSYFECVFGSSFEKVITKREDELIKCEMKFDDPRFSNRLYGVEGYDPSQPSKDEELDVQHFRYLSFFETYDFDVKNEIVENPNLN